MSPVDDLEKRIDTNRNNYMEPQEIINFLKNDENVQELWKRLGEEYQSSRFNMNYNRKFFNAVDNAIKNSRKLQQKIWNKIKNGEELTAWDIFFLYLKIRLDNNILGNNINIPAITDSQDIYTKYGWRDLLQYIRTTYNNPWYEFWKWWPNSPKAPNFSVRKRGSLPQKTSSETQKKKIELPKIATDEKYYSSICRSFSDLEKRVQNNYLTEYHNEYNASRKRNEGKWNRKNDYIQYDIYIFSLKKYQKFVEQKHTEIVNWIYQSEDAFNNQSKLSQGYFEDLEKIDLDFPQIQEVIKKLSEYNKKLEEYQKKYLGKWVKEDVAQKKYENYIFAIERKQKEMWISKKSFNKEPTNQEEAIKFFENMERTIQFQAEQEKIKKQYGGKMIDNYENYVNAKWNLIKQYGKNNLEGWIKMYKNYQEKMNDCKNQHKWFDVEKYQQYTQKILNSWLQKHFENLRILSNSLTIENGNVPKNFPIQSIKDDNETMKTKQAETDKRWENLKQKSPFLYEVCNVWARAINAARSSTIWTGAKLWALILTPFFDDDEMSSIWEKTETWARGWHINMYTKQSKWVYENGQIVLNWDNWPWIISESIVNMCTLIYGWWAIKEGLVKWATKAWVSVWARWINVAWKVWLFSSWFLQQVWPSFQEWFNAWMTWNQALLYCVVNAGIQWGLELVSPNEFLLWWWKNIAKAYIKELLKSGEKQSLKVIWKMFLKNVGSEIVEENLQEVLQLAAWNLVNMWANDQFDLWKIEWDGTKRLDADRNPKNFAATALVTTITTWLVTTWSFAMQTPWMWNTQSREQLILHIQNNLGLYTDVMNILDDAIAWKIIIPNVKIQELENLKSELNRNKNQITWSIDADYFGWKSHKFEVTEQQTRENSAKIDVVLSEINEWNMVNKLQELREEINKQYKEITWKELELTDNQLLSVLDAHEQDWILWELNLPQLKKKVVILAETIKDDNIRRFLLEAGFCGMEYSEKCRIFNEYEDFINVSHVNSLEQNVLFNADVFYNWGYINEQPSSYLSVSAQSILWSTAIDWWNWIKNDGEIVGWRRDENWTLNMKKMLMTPEWRRKLFVLGSPVNLAKIKWFNWEDLYWVESDWNHRVVAAKQIWLSHILAEVYDYSIDNSVEKIIRTDNKALVCERIARISKWYIKGEVQKCPPWLFELHFSSWAFDGCHLSFDWLYRYKDKYEQLCWSINDVTADILRDILSDSERIYYSCDLNIDKVIDDYFDWKFDEIKREFGWIRINDSWMDEFQITT